MTNLECIAIIFYKHIKTTENATEKEKSFR